MNYAISFDLIDGETDENFIHTVWSERKLGSSVFMEKVKKFLIESYPTHEMNGVIIHRFYGDARLTKFFGDLIQRGNFGYIKIDSCDIPLIKFKEFSNILAHINTNWVKLKPQNAIIFRQKRNITKMSIEFDDPSISTREISELIRKNHKLTSISVEADRIGIEQLRVFQVFGQRKYSEIEIITDEVGDDFFSTCRQINQVSIKTFLPKKLSRVSDLLQHSRINSLHLEFQGSAPSKDEVVKFFERSIAFIRRNHNLVIFHFLWRCGNPEIEQLIKEKTRQIDEIIDEKMSKKLSLLSSKR